MFRWERVDANKAGAVFHIRTVGTKKEARDVPGVLPLHLLTHWLLTTSRHYPKDSHFDLAFDAAVDDRRVSPNFSEVAVPADFWIASLTLRVWVTTNVSVALVASPKTVPVTL